MAAGALVWHGGRNAEAAEPAGQPPVRSRSQTNGVTLEDKREEAEKKLRAMVQKPPYYDKPVLTSCGGEWGWIWLEISALESLLYAKYDPDVALATHELFFDHQREDGLIPAVFNHTGRFEEGHVRYGQIQQCVPIARTSYELAKLTRNEAFLQKAYTACCKFDDWMVAYRQTRETKVFEMFCEFDMGQDNSPRCSGNGIPRSCPGYDARNSLKTSGFPVLAPDVSAIVYGNRVALAKMAEELGKGGEARTWQAKALELQQAILDVCFDSEDEFFYDVDTENRFRKFRGAQIFVVCEEHVLSQDMFEKVYHRYLRNPHEFWTPIPFPAMSIADPHYDWKGMTNNWGGGCWSLIMLRTLLWMQHYGKADDQAHLMRRWLNINMQWDHFHTQCNPWYGHAYTGWNFVGRELNTSLVCFLEFAEKAAS